VVDENLSLRFGAAEARDAGCVGYGATGVQRGSCRGDNSALDPVWPTWAFST
jgi:hypothetical protein